MSGRGKRAALPPSGYRRPPVLDEDGLVVRPVSGAGVPLGVWDFRGVAGPEDFRRELVAALAAQGRGWDSVETWRSGVGTLRLFLTDASAAEPPVAAACQITVEWWKAWAGDVHTRRVLAAVVRRAPGVPPVTRVFLEAPRRRPPARRGTRRKRAHTREELKAVRDAATATVRAARRRIAANAEVLQRWRAGLVDAGDGQFAVGELLDVLARTGDLPRYENGKDRSLTAHVERTLGFQGVAAGLTRLFPTLREAGAAAVLLITHEAWNLSVLKAMEVPGWWPNADGEDPAIHQVDTDKARRGRHRYASNTLVDLGEGTSGRALRHVLEMTAHARATLGLLGQPTNRLLVAHQGMGGSLGLRTFTLGNALSDAIRRWHRDQLAAGVPLPPQVSARSLRHTAQVHHGRARNNTRATNERDYQLRDEQVRDDSRGAVELGLEQAMRSAQQTVAMRLIERRPGTAAPDAEHVAEQTGVDIEVANRLLAGHLQTPVASCTDFTHSEHSPPGTPCAVSFLLCFACRNAVATGRDLPRIAYLHQGLESLRSAVTGPVWAADWAVHHAGIGDFLTTHTTADSRPALAAALSDRDRALIDRMLERRLDP